MPSSSSTPKSKRSESRRSSILKPRKPRQPLQNVNFDSPHNEKSLTPSKIKRRVSFADKKHVKEFCHSIEQGTVWDNTYEEHDSKHDSSLKGSFVSLDSNAKTESKENASLCISNNEYVHILENNSSCSINSNLTNNQLFESNIKVKEKDNENCDLDFTNPIEMKLFDEGFQFQETILPNKSGISQPSKDAILSGIACSNTDEKYVEPSDETSQHEQNVTPNALFRSRVPKNATSSNIIIYRDSNEENNASNTTNALSVSNVSKNATSSNIIIYRDSDEEKNSNNTGIKSYSELCCNNVDSELDMTCAQDLSMEFTTPMHTPLLSLHAEEEINVQKDECSLNLNLNTNWVSNCNNVSIQAVPISVKPVNFDLGIFEQISKIQTHGSTNSTVGNNTHNKTIFSTNLQSNIASENTVFKHTRDATQNINESMMLTNVIQPSTTSIDISHINNSIQTHGSTNSTAGNNTHNKTIFSTNLQSNIASENTVFKHTQDATQNINESMMLTNVIQPSTTSIDISHINNSIQTHGSTNSTAGNNTHNKTIFSTNLQSNIASENTVFKHTQNATQNVNESMMLTNVLQPSTTSTDISHINNPIQTHGSTNSTAGNNTHNKTIFSTNLQSNIASENTVFKHTQNATQNVNESMMLTNVLQPSTTSTDISHINNPIQTHGSTNSTAVNNTHNKTIFSTNLQSNIASENTVFKHTQDATQNVNESMMLTNVIQPSTTSTDISHINNPIQTHGSTNSTDENNTHNKTIFSTNLQSNIASENTVFKHTQDATQNINESMMLTNVIQPSTTSIDISHINNPIQTHGSTNSTAGNNTHNKTIFSTNLQSNIASENTVFKHTQNATQNVNESMMLTNVIQPSTTSTDISHINNPIQTHGSTNSTAENNTHNKTIFSTNLQSYIASENTVFKHTQDATQNINESMMLTNVIQPSTTSTDISHINNPIQTHGSTNSTAENNTHNKTIFSTNLQSNIASENTVFKHTQDATQNINESMMLTNVIQPSTTSIDISHINNPIQTHGSTNSTAGNNTHNKTIFSTNLQSNIASENTVFKHTQNATQNVNESMMLTNVLQPSTTSIDISHINNPIQTHGSTNSTAENNTHNKTIFSTNLQSNIASENTVFKHTQDATQNINESMMLTNVIQPSTTSIDISHINNPIQTHGSTNSTAGNNTHNKTIFSTNLQSNIASENTVFKHTQDATQNINESMMLTNVIQSSTTSTDISHINNPIQTHGSTNSTAENNTHNKTIFSTNLQSNIASENTVFKHTQDATQNINESMMLTNVIQPSTTNIDISHINNPIQTHGSTNSTAGNNTHNKTIFSTNLQSNIASKNTVFKHTQNATQNVNESMMLTNVLQPSTTSTDISHINNPIQTHGSTNSTAVNNTHNKTIFSTNLQSNIASENTVFKHTQDATQNINESMMLTNVIQPSTTSIDISHINNPIQTHGSTNSTAGNNTHNKTIFSTNLQSNIASENTVFKHTQNATQNVNESMMLTNVIQPSTTSTDISHVNNTAFNVSMEMTTAISSKMYDRNIAHPHDENIIRENNLRENQIDKTEFFNDVMEITKPVNMLPLIAYDKENLKIDELISKDDRTMFFHDVSMEMTKVLKNQEEITRPIIQKPISEESTCKKKNMDNSNGFDEKTRLLYKSMEITEAVPVSLHHEKTLNTICAAQSTSFSQTMSKARMPVENSTESTFQADTAANKTAQHVSMEITDTILSTLHLTQDATNERKNLNISRDNEFQHLTTDNLTKLKKSAAKENYIISREFTETTDTHDELPDNFVIPSLSNNLDHSLNAVLKNISSTNKRIFDENEQSNSKKICKSFMEFHTPQENNVCLSPRPNDIYINDTGHNECFVKDTMDHTGLSRSNFRDDLNEISDCSLLKTMGNSIEELQSIKPPSFILLDSYKDENSFSDALCKDKLQISTGDGTIDNIHNSSNQLVIDNITEYECLAESRKSIAKDNESFTVLRENESINIENIQMEDCSRRTIANKTEQEDDCQAIRKIIINDNRINESNHCRANVENFHAENVLSIQNNKHEETNTDHCKSPIIKENEIIAEVEYIQERVNNDANPQNNVKEKEEYSDVQRLKTEQCTDHIKRLEAIENQLNSENNCKENLNDEVKVTEMEQNEECTEERLAVERCVSANEDESLVEQDPFLSLSQKLETHCERDDCIWNMYHKNIDRKMFVFGFISNSLLIAMYLSYDLNCSEENLINKIKIISRVSDDSGVLVRIVHKLILEKLDAKLLMYSYRTHEDILPMLECVSEHVKLAMNFMFDLKHLDNLNLMEITYDHISFLSRSKQMDIILKVTVKVKRFDELTSKDVNVHCLLGTIRETDVKSLIKNIKKDHKFLRKYINDVKVYIDIMEETSIAKKV
ncbi:hypothetical protein ACS0PU_009547 [Formica fusca]